MTSYERISRAIAAAGTSDHIDRLVDFVSGLAPHDRITVARYTPDARPHFVTHRNFSPALVECYLNTYYPFDPFDAYWRRRRQPGVVPLGSFTSPAVTRSRYVVEFLRLSAIHDEIGLLLADGPEATLGIFLERSEEKFAARDVEVLKAAFPAVSALHSLHTRITPRVAEAPATDQWPQLTRREREVAALILAGHPTRSISARLGLSAGTIRNHRHSIYQKLDITSEREMFLNYIASRSL